MGNVFTQRGYPLDEVISTLQKEIRRGNEESALYWCFEAIPGFEQYVWRRLLVIVNEDIGLANPLLLQLIPSLRSQFFEFREEGKNGTCRLILANAIALMCRSPKSRLADHLQRVVSQAYMTGERRAIPDYAVDKHTRRGKSLGRGVEHWLAEGCQLNPPAEVEDPYREPAEAHWRAGRVDAPNWGRRLSNGKLVEAEPPDPPEEPQKGKGGLQTRLFSL